MESKENQKTQGTSNTTIKPIDIRQQPKKAKNTILSNYVFGVWSILEKQKTKNNNINKNKNIVAEDCVFWFC